MVILQPHLIYCDLQHKFVFWYTRLTPGVRSQTAYEDNIKKIVDFSTVRIYFQIHSVRSYSLHNSFADPRFDFSSCSKYTIFTDCSNSGRRFLGLLLSPSPPLNIA